MENYPPLLRTLLVNRGINDAEAADRFLNPDYARDLHDPFLILNMERAVERILRAITSGERITVWGDYDCDGIPGTVVLHDFFEKIGYKNISVYIPHRYSEGYGLNVKGIKQLAREGTTLVVTVDSGITDVEPVATANKLGVDVIITDHHLPQEKLPPAYAILNSKQSGDTYPFPLLSGAGVAFKLVQALIMRGDFGIPAGWEKWLLDVAGISTIADMVPLFGENRALAHFGLKVLRRTSRPGLLSLFRKARVDQRTLSEDDIGFSIGPRINAASRMGEPIEGFHLLSTKDPARAVELAAYLESKNNERKRTVLKMIEEIDDVVRSAADAPVIVVGKPNWKPGVVGLAAARIVERYGKTAFVWGGDGSTDCKGSCRSDGTLNIVELMGNAVKGTFLDFGGHEFAGGFSTSRAAAGKLAARLLAAHRKTQVRAEVQRSHAVDGDLLLSDVTWDLHHIIQMLAPYGVGNPKPLFRFPAIRVRDLRRFGKSGEHLELSLAQDQANITATQFFAPAHKDLSVAQTISLVAHVEKNSFMRRPVLQLRLVDILR